MPDRVNTLLDGLEARLDAAHQEIAALRDENRRLRACLAAGPASPPVRVEPPSEGPALSDPPREGPVPTLASPPCDAPKPSAATLPESPPSPQALLDAWMKRYPKTFFKADTRPLKVGIDHDLVNREPYSRKLIRRTLASYVNRPRYLKSMQKGQPRLDLDGNPAGEVDAIAAEHAAAKRRERGRPSDRDRHTAKTAEADKALKKDRSSENRSSKKKGKPSARKRLTSAHPGDALQGGSRPASPSPAHPSEAAQAASLKQTEQNEALCQAQGRPPSMEEKLEALKQRFSAG